MKKLKKDTCAVKSVLKSSKVLPLICNCTLENTQCLNVWHIRIAPAVCSSCPHYWRKTFLLTTWYWQYQTENQFIITYAGTPNVCCLEPAEFSQGPANIHISLRHIAILFPHLQQYIACDTFQYFNSDLDALQAPTVTSCSIYPQ
jgi:hypothetical protein